jgi:methylmalonyl-CoA mutase
MDDALVLAGEFPPPTRPEWDAAVGKVLLKGATEPTVDEIEAAIAKRLTTRTYDGITIEPLYTAGPDGGEVGAAPFTRGTRSGSWDVRQRIALDGPGTAALVVTELERGASSVYLAVAGAERVDADALRAALEGVYLDVAPVVLETGANWYEVGTALLEVLGDTGSGVLGADPIGMLASAGLVPDSAALLALAERAKGRNVRTIVVDSTRYLDAGSSDSEELGCSLATGLAYLRWLTDAGWSVADAAAQIEFRIGVTADQFSTIAKLRAARQAWARITSVAGAVAVQRQHAVTADVMFTRYDPWVNLLRSTTACFAAAAGGADAITVTPFDALREPASTSIGRRLSRNTQAILALESNLDKVADPAGGSWYVETLTQQLADAAWAWFQQIETAGGIVAALENGLVQQHIAATWAARTARLATRKDPLTGLSEFPDIDENLPALAEPQPAPVAGVLPKVRYAAGFEALRDRARGLDAPSVFLANLGPVAVHTARATFAKNLFEVAGIRASANDGFASAEAAGEAFRAHGARIACICSSDTVYAEQAAATAAALKAAGAQRVYLAGNPGDRRDEYVAAGVDEFVFMGVDAEAILGAALANLEAGA